MKVLNFLCYCSLGLLALTTLGVPRANADEWNQKTFVTFSGPVEVPGHVLPAGTYVFKLMDSQSDRDIVGVFNKNETHNYGIFLAIPDYRLRPRGKTVISFEERAAGAPEAIKAWFYPGDNYGHEFVYPKVRASELAQANQQPVPSMPAETAKNTTPANENNTQNMTAMQRTPLKAEKPNQQEVDIYEVFPPRNQAPPPNEQASNNPPAPVQNAPAQSVPNTLPHTGSELPLFGLIGLTSLAAAGVLRYATAKL